MNKHVHQIMAILFDKYAQKKKQESFLKREGIVLNREGGDREGGESP